jgi:pimeloyl-ACP methyl ester carboxylesterase
MHRATVISVIFAALLPCTADTTSPAGPGKMPGAEVRSGIEKALPLLKKGSDGHIAQRTCFACHNQAMPILAFMTARGRGFPFPEEDLKKQRDFIAAFLSRNQDNYRQGKGQGGQADTAGYALLALDLVDWQPDATTEAVVEYLLLRDKDRDHWRATSNRPPSEASSFTTTYVALRALRRWGAAAQQDRIAKRIETVRAWLVRSPAGDTEDRVFRLRALREAGAEDDAVRLAARDLLSTQRKDGGWGQTDALDSDAYATGSALVALHQTGSLRSSDSAYERGVAFLLKNQLPDGSWLVRSRSRPFQPYYESGFPHGKDQFISMAATAWATTALALALPPGEPPADRFARFGELRVHYQSFGRGDTAVVLIHGWTCDASFWQAQVPALVGKVRTLVIDLPGHGRSDKPNVEYSMDYFARAVDAVLRDAGVEKAVLVGHSMGTPVARQFYRLYSKRTIGLVAVDGDLHTPLATQAEIDKHVAPFTRPDFKDAIGKAVDGMFTAATPEEVRRSIKKAMLAAPQHVVVGAMRGMLDLSVWKDDPIRVPLQVIVAKQPYWPADHERKVRALAPHADYRVMDGVGHFLMMEKPERFNAALMDFLKKQGLLAE